MIFSVLVTQGIRWSILESRGKLIQIKKLSPNKSQFTALLEKLNCNSCPHIIPYVFVYMLNDTYKTAPGG